MKLFEVWVHNEYADHEVRCIAQYSTKARANARIRSEKEERLNPHETFEIYIRNIL